MSVLVKYPPGSTRRLASWEKWLIGVFIFACVLHSINAALGITIGLVK